MRIELKDRIGSDRQDVVPEGRLPDMRESALSWASSLREILPEKAGEKLLRLYQSMPHDDRMIRDYENSLR